MGESAIEKKMAKGGEPLTDIQQEGGDETKTDSGADLDIRIKAAIFAVITIIMLVCGLLPGLLCEECPGSENDVCYNGVEYPAGSPCDYGEASCGDNTMCAIENGEVSCSCLPGFEFVGATKDCALIG